MEKAEIVPDFRGMNVDNEVIPENGEVIPEPSTIEVLVDGVQPGSQIEAENKKASLPLVGVPVTQISQAAAEEMVNRSSSAPMVGEMNSPSSATTLAVPKIPKTQNEEEEAAVDETAEADSVGPEYEHNPTIAGSTIGETEGQHVVNPLPAPPYMVETVQQLEETTQAEPSPASTSIPLPSRDFCPEPLARLMNKWFGIKAPSLRMGEGWKHEG